MSLAAATGPPGVVHGDKPVPTAWVVRLTGKTLLLLGLETYAVEPSGGSDHNLVVAVTNFDRDLRLLLGYLDPPEPLVPPSHATHTHFPFVVTDRYAFWPGASWARERNGRNGLVCP